MRTALRRVLAGTDERAEVELDALNRRGRQVRVSVKLLRLGLDPGDVNGAILLPAPMDGAEPRSGDGADGDGADGDG